MDDLLDALARLSDRLERLELRVSALERSSETANSRPSPATAPARETPAAGEFALPPTGGVFPVVGKAMLGIAGAYLLRAVAESGSLPQLVIVALALAYAGMWLLWAARVPANIPFASTAWAVTSALILAPMLWELTLRFKVLPASVTAGVLTAFVAGASALAWKRNLAPVLWVANVTAVFTALALMIATHDLAPFVSALLIMALASESAADRNRWLRLRFLVAPAADLAVWILIYIDSLPESSRSEYAAVQSAVLLTLPSALFLIYGASVTWRTTVLRQRITIFEIVQTVIAFLLAAFGWLWFGPAVRAGLGIFCLLLSAACYALAFVRFDRLPEQRNYYVYSTWSAVLLLVGSFLCLPPLPAAASVTIGNSRRQRRRNPARLCLGLAGGGRHDPRRIPCRRHPHPHYLRSGTHPRLRRLPLAAHRTRLDRLRHAGLCHRQASVPRLAPRPLGIHRRLDLPLRRRFDYRSSHGAPGTATPANRGLVENLAPVAASSDALGIVRDGAVYHGNDFTLCSPVTSVVRKNL